MRIIQIIGISCDYCESENYRNSNTAYMSNLKLNCQDSKGSSAKDCFQLRNYQKLVKQPWGKPQSKLGVLKNDESCSLFLGYPPERRYKLEIRLKNDEQINKSDGANSNENYSKLLTISCGYCEIWKL